MFVDDRRHLDQLRATAVSLWVLVVLMYVVISLPDTRAWVQGIDDRILTWAVDAETDPVVSVAKTASFIGSSLVMVPFMIVVAGYLCWRKRMMTTVFWVSAFAASEALTWATKFIYARPRPPMALVRTLGYSFPSGHAGTAATVAVGVVLLLAIRGSRHWYWWTLAAMYITAIAWSRIYLHAHWFSDVFTGATLGAAVALTAFLVVSSLGQRGKLSAGEDLNHPT